MADVFISYHEASAGELAEQIADRLEDAGISCWCARRDMSFGGDFARSIPAQIDSCKVFLLLLNENVYHSDHIENEVGLAFSRRNKTKNIHILPLEIGDFTRKDWVRYYLIHIQSVKFPENPDEQRIQRLLKRVTKLLAKEKSLPPTSIHTQSDKFPENTDEQRPQGLAKWFEKLLGKAPAPQQKPKPEPPLQNIVKSGKCGDNVTYTLDENGVLTISGTGPMRDFKYAGDAPWLDNDKTIFHIVIQNGVTIIGDCAFIGCVALTSVAIPDSVRSIGNWAFDGCAGLTSVTIPESVSTIRNWTFSDCTGLTSVTIPNSVVIIEDCAFYGCTKLTSVSVPIKAEIAAEAFPSHVRIIYRR